MAGVRKKKSKETRVKAEYRRLKEIFGDLTPDEASVCDGLIWQAARLRVLLDDMWMDISENGDVEMFTQSPDTPPYERQRPVAQLFNTRDKNYQTIIKQLCDRLPNGDNEPQPGSEIFDFVRGGGK